MLAICRGMQVMNVAAGGSLHQHIEEREPHRSRRSPDGETILSGWHGVDVTRGTLLSRVARAAHLRVNSRHHQAVTRARLAPGLVASALTSEGGMEVVEAIEAPHHPFALGVQWHPERSEMAATPALAPGSGALFEAFLKACATSVAAPETAFLYFGYGSSMDAERMRQTAPHARLIGPARLADHVLAFSIESKNTWHGGVANILPSTGDEVWGALWLVPAEESHALDEHEGLFREPPAYRRVVVDVTTPTGDRVRCRSYQVVSPDPRTPPPSRAFKETLIRGARTVGLPAPYVALLSALPDNGHA
jgi:GMP synthase-like glutamine amidotransferase/cation transport regulator ChaC